MDTLAVSHIAYRRKQGLVGKRALDRTPRCFDAPYAGERGFRHRTALLRPRLDSLPPVKPPILAITGIPFETSPRPT